MKRRELLKALAPLAAVPLVLGGKAAAKAYPLDPKYKYLILARRSEIDINMVEKSHLGVDAEVWSVDDPDEAVRIFKLT